MGRFARYPQLRLLLRATRLRSVIRPGTADTVYPRGSGRSGTGLTRDAKFDLKESEYYGAGKSAAKAASSEYKPFECVPSFILMFNSSALALVCCIGILPLLNPQHRTKLSKDMFPYSDRL